MHRCKSRSSFLLSLLHSPLSRAPSFPHRLLPRRLLQHRPRGPGAARGLRPVTAEFLAFSRARGNDLSTPHPEFGFARLKAGDRWCLCAARWVEALEAGVAPKAALGATHRSVFRLVPLEVLKAHALPGRAATSRSRRTPPGGGHLGVGVAQPKRVDHVYCPGSWSWPQSAARTAPRAKSMRSVATCFRTTRSPGPAKITSCSPTTSPPRRLAKPMARPPRARHPVAAALGDVGEVDPPPGRRRLPDISAVPDGASTFAPWCISTISTSYPGPTTDATRRTRTV